jgi:hypothetical protein
MVGFASGRTQADAPDASRRFGEQLIFPSACPLTSFASLFVFVLGLLVEVEAVAAALRVPLLGGCFVNRLLTASRALFEKCQYCQDCYSDRPRDGGQRSPLGLEPVRQSINRSSGDVNPRDELARWTRVGFERGMRSRKGER